MTRSLAFYGLAALLVVAYVNTFIVWKMLQIGLGETVALVPWFVAVVVTIGLATGLRRREHRNRVSAVMLIAALAVAFAGMLVADPQFPAKRVHVPQYALLSGVVWAALRERVGVGRVALYTVVVASLFGVHDEFLQGLHPERTYGLRDMAVNLSGCVAGALALSGFNGRGLFTADAISLPPTLIVGLAMAFSGFALYVPVPVIFRGVPIPYWSLLPLLAGVFALACALARDEVDSGQRHFGIVVCILLLMLFVYPVLANETKLVFA